MGDSATMAKVLSGLADSDLFAFVLLDSSGVIVFANRSAVSLLGLTVSDVVGRSYRDPAWAIEAIDGGPFPPEELPFARVMRLRRSVTDVRHAIRWPDGIRKCLSISAEPVFDRATGEVAFVAVTLQDVTEAVEAMHRLEEARRKAEEASLAREKFLATMSHEMRTPLHAVLGAMELLSVEIKDRQQASLIRQAEESAQILLGIIEDILDISRLTANAIEIKETPFNLNGLIGDIAKVVRGLYKLSNLEVIFDVAVDIPEVVVGDRKRIGQIILNLIGNAVKFTEKGRVVFSVDVVSSEESEIVLRFGVSDTGIGIPEEWREAIFDAFSQVDGSRDRRFGGSGLGLAISRQLARLMGGDLRVQSEVGRGSQFWFEAPFARGGTAPGPNEPQQVPGTSSRRAAIVLAHDPLKKEAFGKAARGAGLSVLQMTSLADLKEKISSGENYSKIIFIVEQCSFEDASRSLYSTIRELSSEFVTRLLLVRNGPEEGGVKNTGSVAHVVMAPLTALDIQEAMNANDDNPKERRVTPLPALSGKRVLLVEDSPANARLVIAMLKLHGVAVDWRDNGQAGLDALMATPDGYNAVLVDIQMPGMDGYEVVRRMRRLPMLASLPAMAVTANAFPEDKERAFAAGFDMFLAKPFTSLELGRSLRSLFELASVRRSPDADERFPNAHGKGSGLFTADGGRIRPAAFDSARALELMDGSEDLLRSFVKDALPHFETSVARARQAVSESRIADAARELHTLKGLAATLFADLVMQKAESMRIALRDGSRPDEQDWLKLEMDCSVLVDDLRKYMITPMMFFRSLDECLADFKACLDSGSLRAVDCAIEAERLAPALTGLAGLVRSGNILRARDLLESFTRKRVDV